MKNAEQLKQRISERDEARRKEVIAYKGKCRKKAQRFVDRLTEKMYRKGIYKYTFKNRIIRGKTLQHSMFYIEEVKKLLEEAGYRVHEEENKGEYVYTVTPHPMH